MRNLRFGTELVPDDPLRQSAGYTFDAADRQSVDRQVLELQAFASRAHLNGAHATYLKLVDSDGAVGDVVCSGGGLNAAPTVKVAAAAALAVAGVALGVLLEAVSSGSKALVALRGVIAPSVTGLETGDPGWVRVDADGRCEKVATLADDDVAVGYVDNGGFLTLGVFLPSIAGTDLAAEKLVVDDTTSTLANARPLRNLAATLPILRAGGVPVTISRQEAAGTADELLGLGRTVTGGAAGTVGTGGSVAVRIPDSIGSARQAGRLRWEWTSASSLSPGAKLVVSLLSSDGEKDYVTVGASGALRFHGYTDAGRLGVDSSGNVTSTAITFLEVNTALAAANAVINVAGQKIANVGAPTAENDAATKAYVDGVAQGLSVKNSVFVATTADITLSGLQVIDDVSVTAGKRVLVKDQVAQDENGLWIAAVDAWSRASDLPANAHAASVFVFVEQGTDNQDTGWTCTTDSAADEVGVDPLDFTQFSGAGAGVVTAGAGLTKTGLTLDVVAANGTIVVNADSIQVGTVPGAQVTPDFAAQNVVTTGSITAGTNGFVGPKIGNGAGTFFIGEAASAIFIGASGTGGWYLEASGSSYLRVNSGTVTINIVGLSLFVQSSTTATFATKAVAPRFVSTPSTPTNAATTTIDLSLSQHPEVVIAQDCTIAFTNAVAGQSGTIALTQNGTGGWVVTMPTDGDGVEYCEGTTTAVGTAANRRTIWTYKVHGSGTGAGRIVFLTQSFKTTS